MVRPPGRAADKTKVALLYWQDPRAPTYSISRFLADLTQLMKPSLWITPKAEKWILEDQSAFDCIKQFIVKIPVYLYFYLSLLSILQYNNSYYGLFVLLQNSYPIGYRKVWHDVIGNVHNARGSLWQSYTLLKSSMIIPLANGTHFIIHWPRSCISHCWFATREREEDVSSHRP